MRLLKKINGTRLKYLFVPVWFWFCGDLVVIPRAAYFIFHLQLWELSPKHVRELYFQSRPFPIFIFFCPLVLKLSNVNGYFLSAKFFKVF